MIAYLGDPTLKADILTELDEHRRLDQIVKGTYGEGSNGDWKGCAVGCAIHSLNRKRGTNYKTGDHSAYETGFGIPQSLARLEDGMFENLPDPVYLDWPKRFMGAIRPGADLALVVSRFLHWLLIDPNGIRKNALPNGLVAIDVIVELYRRTLAGETITDTEWSSARSAARSAAESAAESAESARSAWSAWSARSAESAARSAESAARSAESAARSAESARSAWSAWSAWSAEYAASSAWSARSAESAARSAWSAWSARSAESAARSAESAARSAESARSAWSAWSAWSAEYAASSAWSARSAESAAWSAAYVRMADKVIELLVAA